MEQVDRGYAEVHPGGAIRDFDFEFREDSDDIGSDGKETASRLSTISFGRTPGLCSSRLHVRR